MNVLYAQETGSLKPLNEILHRILTFIYFLAHQIGAGIIKVLQPLFPHSVYPDNLVDPLGFLIILTLFMFLVVVAKKIAWIIVCVGWILLLIRILMIIFKLG
jgi:hypothetical protein